MGDSHQSITRVCAFNGLPDTIVSREEFIERPMEAYETIMNSPGWKEFEKDI